MNHLLHSITPAIIVAWFYRVLPLCGGAYLAWGIKYRILGDIKAGRYSEEKGRKEILNMRFYGWFLLSISIFLFLTGYMEYGPRMSP